MEEEYLHELPAESCNLRCIEKNLWLGNLSAASNLELLKEKNVKFILTVNSFPLSNNIRNLNFIENKYIEVCDTPEDDLLSHFEESYQFVENGLKKGVVLVHCYYGVSRSATIILSYIMKRNKMTLEESFRFVKSKSESIAPNSGFLDQLKLYETMGYSLDTNNVQYKMFRLHVTFLHMKKENYANVPEEYYANVVRSDPSKVTESENFVVYKCRKCRRILAHGSNELPHESNGTYNWKENKCADKNKICQQAYFIEPFIWMDNVKFSPRGRIKCPNKSCGNKLGSFDWISDIQCPCGTKVCPGFYLVPSKVDKVNCFNSKIK